MYKKGLLLGWLLLMAIAAFTTSSCARKSGCPAYESLHSKSGRNGELSMKGGSSQLFPKDMRKKMKRH